ncbi:MAG TPA: hypothetical protein VKU19_18425 [Bryobacteraceae bacterium]|nr:hypothetical protein [Bryobacteraceae bacterium]
MFCTFRKAVVSGGFAVGLLTLASSTQALANNLIVNGGFEQTTNGLGQFDDLTQATGWTSAPLNGQLAYNFLFGPGTADTTGENGQYGNLQLWGPNNGSNNGLPATSPDGGNFVAADGAFQTAPITQVVNGLTPGADYTVSFYWAGAQQSGFSGATTEQWQVSLGAQTQSTPILDNADHGFTGWQLASFTYTATQASEVLSFLAAGTPDGEPPFSLLDGVSMSAAPEPGTAGLLVGGLLCALGAIRFGKKVKS